ncbi:hypothetical protein [Microbulbifer pacificus]|uniref:hypothetical protein n=1 Tax=Microbulbifer pacificus TaxID=407164 RepID=UPI000CF3E5CB|nr:hypothetical protein [Microbulbifer pacificus]
MKKQIKLNQADITETLLAKIANLELEVATEYAAKKAVMEYATKLENELEELKNEEGEDAKCDSK